MVLLSGIDIVDNRRIKKLIERSPQALSDIFSSKEIEYCNNKKYPENSFAARFAAKEAIIKATHSGIFDYELHLIETVNLESGQPVMNLYSEKLKDKIRQLLKKNEYTINISLSHEKDYSIAQAIIY
jgi:holo-[acyl-carrier protein] synthase